MANAIGSKIQLISKADIRYEGLLYSIDAEEATVALENVRSFGTEGRRGGVQEIPPSDQVYEYVMFRGADIKDLHVCEPPPQPQQRPQPPPTDPAIIGMQRHPAQQVQPQSQKSIDHSFASFQAPAAPSNPFMVPPQAFSHPAPTNYWTPPNWNGPPVSMTGTNQDQIVSQKLPANQQPTISAVRSKVVQQAVKKPEEPVNFAASFASKVNKAEPPLFNAPSVVSEDLRSKLADEFSKVSVSKGESVQLAAAATISENRQIDEQRRTTRSFEEYQGPRRGGYRGGRGGYRGGRGGAHQRGAVMPATDFDFVQSNAKFSEIANVVDEQHHQQRPPSETFYSKKSFFDNISCESNTEKAAGSRKGYFAEERKVNIETFGRATAHHHRGRGRGGGGGGGRGGSSGGYNNRRFSHNSKYPRDTQNSYNESVPSS